MSYHHNYFPERRRTKRTGPGSIIDSLYLYFDKAMYDSELDFTLPDAARYINLPRRELTVRIRNEGTTFSQLLSEWRKSRIKSLFLNSIDFNEQHTLFKMTHQSLLYFISKKFGVSAAELRVQWAKYH